MRPRPPRSTLFPYTTLFRSRREIERARRQRPRLHGRLHEMVAVTRLHPASLEIAVGARGDRKSTRLNSSHRCISYAVFCLKKKKNQQDQSTERRPDKTDRQR